MRLKAKSTPKQANNFKMGVDMINAKANAAIFCVTMQIILFCMRTTKKSNGIQYKSNNSMLVFSCIHMIEFGTKTSVLAILTWH